MERLLALGQQVVGLDNFATGHRRNIDDALRRVGADATSRFRFVEGDIRDPQACQEACRGVDLVLHQAALGSVPRSVQDPAGSNVTNVDGTINMLVAARDANVERFVYASSSSVYGDDPSSTKREDRLGRCLSPYAVTKLTDELYADVFTKTYGMGCIGLRYFNVFGPRQDPNGPYAAVIPRWIEALLAGSEPVLFGDGTKSRDFCFVENVIQGNVLAATSSTEAVDARVFNIACGERTTLDDLFLMIRAGVAKQIPEAEKIDLKREAARVGDIAHSLAEIDRAKSLLGYEPVLRVGEGLQATVQWYVERKLNERRQAPARRESSAGELDPQAVTPAQ
jgi:UDP-N-acetylglucosamine 4-epimerase